MLSGAVSYYLSDLHFLRSLCLSAQHGIPFLIFKVQYFFQDAVPQFRTAFCLGSIRISGISSHISSRMLFRHWSFSCLPACLPAFLPVRISSSKLMSFRPFHLPFLVSLKTTLCSSSYHNTCAVMVYIPLCNRSLCQCGISECSVIAVMLSASSVYTNWASSVFMAVAVNNAVVWDVTPCSVIELCQRCGRACCASFQDRM